MLTLILFLSCCGSLQVFASDKEQKAAVKIQRTYRKHRQERLEKQKNISYAVRKQKNSDLQKFKEWSRRAARL